MSSTQSYSHVSPTEAEVAHALRVLAAAKSHELGSRGPERKEELDSRLRAAERILAVRRGRNELFGDELFGEASWDILLSLYVAHRAQYRMTITAVCNEAGVPQTTALRWLHNLLEMGLVSRRPNIVDRRAVFVELTPAAIDRMDQLVDSVLSLHT